MLDDPRWELVQEGDNLVAVSISASLSLSLEVEGGERCLIVGPDDRDDPEYGVVPLCVVLGLLRAAGYQVRYPLDTEEPQPEATGPR